MSDLATIDAAELERRRTELVEHVGPWQHFNFHLRDGVFTIGGSEYGREGRLEPVIGVIEDVIGPVNGLRALDLGCMEGLFTIELALRGAQAVGVEGREAHVARAEFARDAIGVDAASFHLDDVRNLTVAAYGEFDLTLALGILYHLDAPAAFEFVHRVAAVTKRAAIFDTHYSLRPVTSWTHDGATYSGITVREHDATDTHADRDRSYASSIENLDSIWLTKESLFNLLADAGFASVLEVRIPHVYPDFDRVHLVALKRSNAMKPKCTPHLEGYVSPRWKERERPRPSPQQSLRERSLRRLAAVAPAPLRRALITRRRSQR